ncbi:hypothetical protein AGIG_G19745 [Arapaima gigas]
MDRQWCKKWRCSVPPLQVLEGARLVSSPIIPVCPFHEDMAWLKLGTSEKTLPLGEQVTWLWISTKSCLPCSLGDTVSGSLPNAHAIDFVEQLHHQAEWQNSPPISSEAAPQLKPCFFSLDEDGESSSVKGPASHISDDGVCPKVGRIGERSKMSVQRCSSSQMQIIYAADVFCADMSPLSNDFLPSGDAKGTQGTWIESSSKGLLIFLLSISQRFWPSL